MNARSGVTSARRRTTSPQRTSRLKTPTDTTALSFYVFYGLSLFLLYVIQCMSSVSGPVPLLPIYLLVYNLPYYEQLKEWDTVMDAAAFLSCLQGSM